MLPRSTVSGISWVDSLFISTSAVCVTGLTSVDVASTFTTTGFVIIILLIQIGGLGVIFCRIAVILQRYLSFVFSINSIAQFVKYLGICSSCHD